MFVNGREAATNNYVTSVTKNQPGSVRTASGSTLNPRKRIFGREYLRDDSRAVPFLPDGSGNITSGFTGDTLTRADSIAAEHNWTISASKVNQLRFGYTRRGFTRGSLRTGQSASTVTGIPNIPVSAFQDALPIFDIVGFQQLGPTATPTRNFNLSSKL